MSKPTSKAAALDLLAEYADLDAQIKLLTAERDALRPSAEAALDKLATDKADVDGGYTVSRTEVTGVKITDLDAFKNSVTRTVYAACTKVSVNPSGVRAALDGGKLDAEAEALVAVTTSTRITVR